MFKGNQEIFSTILLAVLLFLSLSVIIGLLVLNFKRNQQKHFIQVESMKAEFEKQLLQVQIEVQEATFSTLGKELHDNIGQLLSTTKMLLGLTERSLSLVPDTLNTANETLGKAINELRALTKSLSKEWLEQFDFIENLNMEVSRLNADERLIVQFACEDKVLLTPEKQIVLFRIVQEGLQNAVKHSGANHLQIRLTVHGQELMLLIEDNGRGFDTHRAAAGLGILHMKQRIHLLNGSITWNSSLGTGTSIKILLPVQNLQHEN